jgi:hypothetical protein
MRRPFYAKPSWAAFALPLFEPVGDCCCRRVRDSNVRDIFAHQRGVRIDLKGDGNQRKYKDGGQGSHGCISRARLRPNRSGIAAKSGSFISECPARTQGGIGHRGKRQCARRSSRLDIRPQRSARWCRVNSRSSRARDLKNESYRAVVTLPVFRGRDRTDLGVPIDTPGRCAACLLR